MPSFAVLMLGWAPVLCAQDARSLDRITRELDGLKRERENLRSLGDETGFLMQDVKELDSVVEMRLKVRELLKKLALGGIDTDRPAKPAPAPAPHREPGPPLISTVKPIDPFGLGRTLFRAGNYQGAVAAFRKIDLAASTPKHQAMIKYMIATCLREQSSVAEDAAAGKKLLEEAALTYEDVAASRADPTLTKYAQWQSSMIQWRLDSRKKLETLKRRVDNLQMTNGG